MKIKMGKIKLLFFIFFLFFLPFFVFAQDLEVQYPTVPGAPLPAQPTLPQYIKYLYNFSIILAGLIALFSLVYGGFRYLISVGQPAAMADAKDQISAGLIGLVILLGSYLFLVAVNPQLAILRFNPQDLPILEQPPALPIQLTAQQYDVYEIPIGQLIERALEPARLNRIVSIANEVSSISGEIRNEAQDFINGVNQCDQGCSNTDPSRSSCGPFPYEVCLPPQQNLFCTGEPCRNPPRDQIEDMKDELKRLADEELAPAMESMLPPLTSLRKDYQRLKLGADILKETIYPINYDNFLEIKQVVTEVGGEVRVIPFIFLGQRTPGRGDPATFYTDEERVRELIAANGFPSFPFFNTLTACNECEIDIRYNSAELMAALRAKKAGFDNPNYPGVADYWDYIINWADQNGWNPAFVLALWGEESGFSRAGAALGCIYYPTGETAPRDIISQLDCIKAHDGIYQDYCQTDNTPFCGFMRYWSGGAGCTLSNNPNFWPNLFDLYSGLIPTAGEGETNPAAPSGNCTTIPGALPPGEAGCPLEPESFSFNGGWHSYCDPGYYHDGVDLGADTGDPIYAVADGVAFGTVDPRGVDYGLGVYVVLQTEFGVFAYAHLIEGSHEAANIPPGGKPVLKGDLIGFVDDTGHTTGPHLHLSFFPDGIINSAHAFPAECLGIQCISVTEAFNVCTDGSQAC